MARTERYTTKVVIAQIKGSGGFKTVVAKRLGCDRHTVDNYIKRHPTVKRAWEAEAEGLLDVAESVVAVNIRVASQIQQRAIDSGDVTGAIVDTDDAWKLLKTKGRNRGYVEKQEQEQIGEKIVRVKWDGNDGTPPTTS